MFLANFQISGEMLIGIIQYFSYLKNKLMAMNCFSLYYRIIYSSKVSRVRGEKKKKERDIQIVLPREIVVRAILYEIFKGEIN